MTPIELAILALLIAAAGMLCAAFVPAPAGRTLGFAAVLLSGAAGVASGTGSMLLRANDVAGSAASHLVIRLDPTAGLFVAIVGAIATLVGVFGIGGRSSDERRTGRTAAASACTILLASLLVCLADDVFFFLFAWELLALAFYWAVTYSGTEPGAETAGYFTLVLTHVTGAALFLVLLVLASNGSSIEDALAGASRFSQGVRSAMFVLLLVGFGGKVGLLPFQGWLPYGYRAAPSVVAALMAGAALNVGFYGIVRFILGFAGPAPLWWGLLMASVGALGAILGISWAAAQRDARSLAAYSSIENSGVIVAGLGIALVGKSIGMPLLVGVGLASAILHIAAHALAKCGLFLSCSVLASTAGSTCFDELGGLARRIPFAATGAILACFSLAAIPPMGGFMSEWLVLESFMQAFRSSSAAVEVTFALCAAAIGIAAGVAVVAFVKFAGIGFLGAPRSDAAARASSAMPGWSAATLLSGLAVLALGVLAPQFFWLIAPVTDGISHTDTIASMLADVPVIQPAFHGFSSASPLGLIVLILGFAAIFVLIAQAFARPPLRRSEPWTSGEPYRPWTQYGGTGFANPTRVILDVGIRTTRTVEQLEGNGVRYESVTRPFFDISFFAPLVRVLLFVSDAVRKTQSGAIASYLTYILLFTIALLLLYPSMRHW